METSECIADLNADLKEQISDLSIDPKDLELRMEDPIGQGNFGIIYMGQLRQDEKLITVAVKTLKGKLL